MKDFELKFSGLTVGKHQFNYEATKMFFESFQGRGLESELIHDGKVAFDVELDKKENLLVFDIIYDGKVNVDCDVCLDQLDVEVSGDSRIIGKYSDELGSIAMKMFGEKKMLFTSPLKIIKSIYPKFFINSFIFHYLQKRFTKKESVTR